MAGAEAGTGSGTAPYSVPPAATPAAAAARVMSSVSAAIVTVAAEETFSCLRLNGDLIAAPPAGRWVTAGSSWTDRQRRRPRSPSGRDGSVRRWWR